MEALTPRDRGFTRGEEILLRELRELYLRAGEPPLRQLAEAVGVSVSTIHAALRDQKRVPSPEVAIGIVRELRGDVSRIELLYDLGRAERHNLLDMAEQIAKKLDLPEGGAAREGVVTFGAHQVSAAGGTINVHTFGPVVSGNVSAVDWLFRDALPASMQETYSRAWEALQNDAYATTVILGRWLLEAICVDQGVNPTPIYAALGQLANRHVIDGRLDQWAHSVARVLDQEIHAFPKVNSKRFAEETFRLVSALLFQIYVINAGWEHFRDGGLADIDD